jgi:Holliday junction DNA helicase RuvA
VISYLTGRVLAKKPDGLVVLVGGLGLEVHVPAGTIDKAPEAGEEISLHTYLHVRQDILQLYGFDSAEARDLFIELMSVTNVGPRLALSVLSVFSPAGFVKVVSESDADALTIIPGVGKKSSQRLILEMREKVGKPLEEVITLVPERRRPFEEAMEALMQLGYSRQEAHQALKKYPFEEGKPRVEDMLQFALKSADGYLSKGPE